MPFQQQYAEGGNSGPSISRVERWMREYYAPALLNKFTRFAVVS
jgi:hypothetical protein